MKLDLAFLKANLANILTLARLALLPFMVILLFIPAPWAAWTCFWLYVIGAVTDFLDGWVARRLNQITPLGTFLDPIADKIYVSALFLMLIAAGHIQGLWVLCVLVILSRELLVSGLREFLGPHNVQMPVTPLAKWKTATQMLALGLLIIGPYAFGAALSGYILLLAATVLTVLTGWLYLKTGLDHINKMT